MRLGPLAPLRRRNQFAHGLTRVLERGVEKLLQPFTESGLDQIRTMVCGAFRLADGAAHEFASCSKAAALGQRLQSFELPVPVGLRSSISTPTCGVLGGGALATRQAHGQRSGGRGRN